MTICIVHFVVQRDKQEQERQNLGCRLCSVHGMKRHQSRLKKEKDKKKPLLPIRDAAALRELTLAVLHAVSCSCYNFYALLGYASCIPCMYTYLLVIIHQLLVSYSSLTKDFCTKDSMYPNGIMLFPLPIQFDHFCSGISHVATEADQCLQQFRGSPAWC